MYPRMNIWSLPRVGLLAASLIFASAHARAGDDGRGRILHDTHCISCHGTKVYQRGSKLGSDYGEIRKQVARWATNISLKWTDSEIDDVTTYLARSFYKVPCPTC